MSTAYSGQAEMFIKLRPEIGDLTPNERNVLSVITAAAIQGRELESSETIAYNLGFDGTGTIRGIMVRLEKAGYISCRSFQRGRQVWVKSIDRWTAAPPCQVPHWREVYAQSKQSTPTLPKQTVSAVPSIAQTVMRLMSERAITFADAQVVLMSYGVSAYEAGK